MDYKWGKYFISWDIIAGWGAIKTSKKKEISLRQIHSSSYKIVYEFVALSLSIEL